MKLNKIKIKLKKSQMKLFITKKKSVNQINLGRIDRYSPIIIGHQYATVETEVQVKRVSAHPHSPSGHHTVIMHRQVSNVLPQEIRT